jgi:hypothetical protein
VDSESNHQKQNIIHEAAMSAPGTRMRFEKLDRAPLNMGIPFTISTFDEFLIDIH